MQIEFKSSPGLSVNLDLIDDPNLFGEAIRGLSFDKETGAYSGFELVEGFEPLESNNLLAMKALKAMGGNPECHPEDQIEVTKEGKVFSNRKDNITVAWYQDEIFFVHYNGKAAVNFDCAEEGNWKWVEDWDQLLSFYLG